MKFSLSTSLLLAAAALIVAGGLYWYFSSGSSGPQPTLLVTTQSGDAETTFRSLLSELQPITFDTSIFSDPRFNVLVDITTAVSPEPAGRLDPFAPVSGTSGM